MYQRTVVKASQFQRKQMSAQLALHLQKRKTNGTSQL